MTQPFGLPAILVGSLVFVFGAALGSFLNVIALRWTGDRGLSARSRSRCPHCRATLTWRELLPVASYLLQGGRCLRCGQRLPGRYLIVELGMGLLYVAIVSVYGVTYHGLLLAGISALLLIALLVDFEQYVLPDSLTLVVAGLTLASLLVIRPTLGNLGGAEWWASPLTGGLLGLGVIGGLYLLTRGRGMGLGDVKLAPVLGLSLGGLGELVALAAAFGLGSIVGLTLLAAGRASLKSPIPFGPFLIAGWWIALLWGPELVTWYTGFLY